MDGDQVGNNSFKLNHAPSSYFSENDSEYTIFFQNSGEIRQSIIEESRKNLNGNRNDEQFSSCSSDIQFYSILLAKAFQDEDSDLFVHLLDTFTETTTSSEYTETITLCQQLINLSRIDLDYYYTRSLYLNKDKANNLALISKVSATSSPSTRPTWLETILGPEAKNFSENQFNCLEMNKECKLECGIESSTESIRPGIDNVISSSTMNISTNIPTEINKSMSLNSAFGYKVATIVTNISCQSTSTATSQSKLTTLISKKSFDINDESSDSESNVQHHSVPAHVAIDIQPESDIELNHDEQYEFIREQSMDITNASLVDMKKKKKKKKKKSKISTDSTNQAEIELNRMKLTPAHPPLTKEQYAKLSSIFKTSPKSPIIPLTHIPTKKKTTFWNSSSYLFPSHTSTSDNESEKRPFQFSSLLSTAASLEQTNALGKRGFFSVSGKEDNEIIGNKFDFLDDIIVVPKVQKKHVGKKSGKKLKKKVSNVHNTDLSVHKVDNLPEVDEESFIDLEAQVSLEQEIIDDIECEPQYETQSRHAPSDLEISEEEKKLVISRHDSSATLISEPNHTQDEIIVHHAYTSIPDFSPKRINIVITHANSTNSNPISKKQRKRKGKHANEHGTVKMYTEYADIPSKEEIELVVVGKAIKIEPRSFENLPVVDEVKEHEKIDRSIHENINENILERETEIESPFVENLHLGEASFDTPAFEASVQQVEPVNSTFLPIDQLQIEYTQEQIQMMQYQQYQNYLYYNQFVHYQHMMYTAQLQPQQTYPYIKQQENSYIQHLPLDSQRKEFKVEKRVNVNDFFMTPAHYEKEIDPKAVDFQKTRFFSALYNASSGEEYGWTVYKS